VSRGVSAIVVANDDGLYFLKDMGVLVQFGGADIASKPDQQRPRG
jgi:hypothetical protein